MRKAQASVEMAVAIVSVLILFLGTILLFFWINQRLLLRQQAYEDTRESATNITREMQVDESLFPELELLGSGSGGRGGTGGRGGGGGGGGRGGGGGGRER